jgi:hypothetical protein
MIKIEANTVDKQVESEVSVAGNREDITQELAVATAQVLTNIELVTADTSVDAALDIVADFSYDILERLKQILHLQED